jgi:hypothetical protein
MNMTPMKPREVNPARPSRVLRPVFSLAAAVFVLGFLSGCTRGPEISITWRSEKPGLKKGVLLRYEAIEVGHVVRVASTPEGSTVQARLEKKNAHYVRTKSTFMFHPASAGGSAFIEVIALDKDAPPAPPNAHFTGSDSAAEVGFKMITTDWKRTAIICVVGLGLLLILVLVVKILLKLWAVVVSLAAGAVAVVYLSPSLETQLRSFLPSEVRADLVAYIVAFFVGSLGASILLGILFKPMRSKGA